MKKVIKILIVFSLAFILKFYIFDLPRQVYVLKNCIEIHSQVDSLQTVYIRQLVKNNNLLIDYLKQDKTTAP